MKFLEITSRFGFSIISLTIYIILYTIFYFSFVEIGELAPSFTIFLLFGLFTGWKGALVLPIVSIIIDELLLKKFLTRLSVGSRWLALLMLYSLIGGLLSYLFYGALPFFIISGIIVAILYMVLYQTYVFLAQRLISSTDSHKF